MSCKGLHAVVWHLDDIKDEDESFRRKFREMEEEYKGYLNNYADNLEYNSSIESLLGRIDLINSD